MKADLQLSQKLLYRTLTNVHYGKPLTQYEHMVHCLDQLRQDVHCQADDVSPSPLSPLPLTTH